MENRSPYGLSLQVVSLEQVALHERFHGRRVADLAERLVAEGRLINPPVAVLNREKYVILDGATRVTAFRHLGYPYIIVQVVDPEQQKVQLRTWYHAVRGESVDDLRAALQTISGLRMDASGQEEMHEAAFRDDTVAHMFAADGRAYRLRAPEGASEGEEAWLGVLNGLVETYGQWGNVERTLTAEAGTLGEQYTDFVALFVFPRFTPDMILDFAVGGHCMPAGITRFIIPGRILRLNAPLEQLTRDEPLEKKRDWLNNLVRERLAHRQVRYYEEPVILLDE